MEPGLYKEEHRLQYHFSPARNWINDPCGLIHLCGEYHLFYQYNPHGTCWGHMNWGHAVSVDLVHWRHLPIAIKEGGGVMIFTGCAVWDGHNTSALGTTALPPIVAVYTGFRSLDRIQDQRVAFSTDRGRTWQQFADNPVLDLQATEFRDPDVFWYDAAEEWRMVVVLATQDRVQFYRSKNLLNWEHLSDFILENTNTDVKEWECPNFVRLAVAGDIRNTEKWVLFLSARGRHNILKHDYGVKYFVGEFDGIQFKCQYVDDRKSWVDNGADFYAPQIWSNLPDSNNRKVWIGWFNNPDRAAEFPTNPWRGSLTIPRTLGLKKSGTGYKLIQKAIKEIATLRKDPWWRYSDVSIAQVAERMERDRLRGKCLHISAVARLLQHQSHLEITVLKGSETGTAIRVEKHDQCCLVSVDARRSGARLANGESALHSCSSECEDGIFDLDLYVDRSSVEVFALAGTVVFSVRVFPEEGGDGVSVTGNHVHLDLLECHTLNSIWSKWNADG